jgi:non-ribosomal peptide synthetase-like protein
MLIALAAKAVLRPGLAPGRYPRRGWVATRVLFLDRLAHVLHVERGAGTPWAARVARLIGAEVGPGARLATLPGFGGVVRIGAGATIESGVDLHGWWIDGDELVVGELEIGPGARVGTRSVLMPGAVIGAGSEIEPGSVVSTAVPPGERWAGSPARKIGAAGESWPERPPPPEAHPRFWRAMYGVGAVGLNLVGLVAALPALLTFEAVNGRVHSPAAALASLIVSSPLLAATFVIGDALVVALAFRAAARPIRPGWHADTGRVAWALWFTGQLTEGSVTALFPLYATIFTRQWLRLHGLRVGRRTEVSTTEGLSPLVSLGETCFVADHPMFAAVRAHRGWLHLATIEVGDRSFIGNGALLPAGSTVGDDCLIGIESNAPSDTPDGTSWFGAPALELPRIPDATDPARTVSPPRRLVLARGATELVRILLPTTVNVMLGTLVLQAIVVIDGAAGIAAAIAALPLLLAAAAGLAVLVTVAMKWLIIGRYRAGDAPLWSSLVWRDEIINSCQEQLACEWVMEKALGTPLVPAYLRLMGAKVGRDVWCETLAVTEFDVVRIGEGCSINRGACIETHLFHDRVLRIGPTDLGAGSTLGPTSAILPDTKLGAGCVVGGRSVVLRGEELPAGTRWHGSPVVPV